jgi:flagellar protein FliL
MAKDKDAKAASGEETPKKSKKKLIIMLLAVVLLLGGGAGAYFTLFAGSGEAEAAPAPEPGAVVPLEAVTINLADGHYLKLKISLQATLDAHAEPDGSKAMDIAIDMLSYRPMDELFSNEERLRFKAELKEKVIEAYEHEVMDVYVTTFVIQ